MGAKILTQDYLKHRVTYNPETGQFFWNQAVGCKQKDSLAGCENGGYWFIKIDKVRYLAHRLAFMYMEGEIPDTDVDHINGSKLDNCWINLRKVERWQNAANAKLNKSNLLGVKNVTQLFDTKKYQVRIANKSYGCFKELKDAEAYAILKRKELYGEFARHA